MPWGVLNNRSLRLRLMTVLTQHGMDQKIPLGHIYKTQVYNDHNGLCLLLQGVVSLRGVAVSPFVFIYLFFATCFAILQHYDGGKGYIRYRSE